VARAGMSIPEIFEKHGEIGFRELEIEIAKEMGGMQDCVFSTGGGIVMNQVNLMYLKQSSVIIRLTADPATIYARIMADGKQTRPMIAKPDPKREIEQLLAFREPFYVSATPFSVDTTGRTIDDVAREIVNTYEKHKT
nr:shikimate kinase [Candidatus Sigynarchaeota archaeon]